MEERTNKWEKATAYAAEKAAEQLRQAEQLVQASFGKLPIEAHYAMVAAVLNAIVLNMHANATAPKA